MGPLGGLDVPQAQEAMGLQGINEARAARAAV